MSDRVNEAAEPRTVTHHQPQPTRPDPVSPTRYPLPVGVVTGTVIVLFMLVVGLLLWVMILEWFR